MDVDPAKFDVLLPIEETYDTVVLALYANNELLYLLFHLFEWSEFLLYHSLNKVHLDLLRLLHKLISDVLLDIVLLL